MVDREHTEQRGASRRARSPALVWVVVLGAVALGGGLLAVADQRPSESARTTAERYLPSDGSAHVVEYNDGSRFTVESAHSTGMLFLLEQPIIAGNDQLQALTDANRAVSETRYWRQIWTDDTGDRGQLTELFQLDSDGVRLLTLTGTENGFSYVPGVLVLPADVAPGATWSSAGAALPFDLLDYQSTSSARAGNDDCLIVESTTNYTDPAQGGLLVQSTTEIETWCPGIGQTESVFENDGTPGQAIASAFQNRTVGEAERQRTLDFSTYEQWRTSALELVVVDPLFGESTIVTTTDSTASATASGLVVFNTGIDVIGYRASGARAERAWVARPGGQVLWLTTIGEVVLVGTTDRVVVAYDSSGSRAWSVQLSDVLGAIPVSDGRDAVLLQVLDGDLMRVKVANGEVLWMTSLSDDSDVTPAVSKDTVFGADRTGKVQAFDLGTGDALWAGLAEKPTHLAANDERVFAIGADGTIQALDARTGAPRWLTVIPGVPYSVALTDDRVVVQSNDVTVAYTHAGTRQWTVAAHRGLLSDGHLILVIADSAAVLADGAGNELANWPVASANIAINHRAIAGPTGFLMVGSDFTLQAVGGP